MIFDAENMIQPILGILSFVLLTSLSASINCPQNCKCQHSRMECKGAIPDTVPGSVTRVTVIQVKLENILDFTGEGWNSVTHLSLNSDLSVIQNIQEQKRVLWRFEFVHLRFLEYLQIQYTSIQVIEERAFGGLQNLKVLDLSNNINLNLANVIKGLNGTDILPNLRELYLSNVTVSRRLSGEFVINEDFYKVIENKPLEVLDISNTEEAVFIYSLGFETAFANLSKLNLSGAGLAAFSFQKCMMKFKYGASFKYLKIIDVSYPLISEKRGSLIFLDEHLYEDIIYNAPPVLEEIYAKNYLGYPAKPTALYNKTHVCLTTNDNNITDGFKVCIIGGFKRLKKLDLSENSLESIDPRIFYAVNNVRYLDISNNKFGYDIAYGNIAKSLYDILDRLEITLISYNGITFIPVDTFRSATKLSVLDLSHNRISEITFTTKYLVSLTKIYLNNNKISYLDAGSMNRLGNLIFKSPENGTEHKSNESLELYGNPFECSCNSVEFIKWLLLMHNQLLTCTLKSKTVTIDSNALSESEYLCKETLVIVAYCLSAGIVVIVCSLVLCLIIRKRRKQRYLAKVNRGVEAYAKKGNDKLDIHPPVFLSFCSEDYEIVFENIFPQLNEGLQKVLGTDLRCVATGAYEFRPGFPVAEEIIRSIETCEVVIFFITKSFCKNKWCGYETIVANADHKPFVLVLWEKVDRKLMPKHIRKCYDEYTRVHWNMENGERIMTPKWNDLCESIVKLMGEQETQM